MSQQEADLLEEKPSELKAAPPDRGVPPAPAKRRIWPWALLAAVALAGGTYYFAPGLFHFPEAKNGQSQAKSSVEEKPKGKRGSGTVQVVAAEVRKGDINMYMNGLGAVTPIYTVTVKSRVDGELTRVQFSEGQIVNKGDLLLEIDPRPFRIQLAQAQAQLNRDQAQLKNARLDLQRYQMLMAKDAIPKQQLSTQEALFAQYEATIQGDEAAIDSARLNLEYCQIKSPITGLVGLRLVDPGNIVHASDTGGMLVITQLDPISVIFTAAEDQIQTVLKRWRAGQFLQVEAWDRDLKNRLSSGKLQTIDNQIDPSTGTFRLRAVFDNRDGALFPSQFVNARMLVEKQRNVTLVPTVAIQRNSQSTYVWLINADQTVAVREVTLLTSEGDDTGVASGLASGDKVVTIGVDRLRAGSKVSLESKKDKSKDKPKKKGS